MIPTIDQLELTGFQECEWNPINNKKCECCEHTPTGKNYFKSDNGYDSREGIYYCGPCVIMEANDIQSDIL